MSDPVDPAVLGDGLEGTPLGPVSWSEAVSSTNDELIKLAREGCPEGRVIGADHQRAGRGRLGRGWVDRPGQSLAISVLLRPPPGAPPTATLAIVAGVAVADVIGPEARLAWPNDVLLRDRKVSGILCEAGASQGATAWVVVGIGVNVRGTPEVPDARWPVGSLDVDGPAPSRQELALGILRGLAGRYREWLDEGTGPVLAAWERRDALAGRLVRAGSAEEAVVGTALGVDAEGRLVVQGPGGPIALASAQVVRLVEA